MLPRGPQGPAFTGDACDAALGCTTHPLSGNACDDDNDCTAADTCTACVCGGSAIAGCCHGDQGCADDDGCTVDACIERSCVNRPLACAVADVCVTGACNAAPITCDDGDACTADSCDSVLGCVHAPVRDESCPPDLHCGEHVPEQLRPGRRPL